MKPIKILMLEDNTSDAGLIERVLQKSEFKFKSIVVDTKEEFIKSLNEFVPDIIFSDHALPQFNSLEAFEILKGTKLNIPFLVVTGAISEEFAIQCLKEGIDDFILKDNLYRLPIAIENAFRKRKLELEKRQLKIEQTSYIDKLKKKNNELIKLNYELDRFVYSASHELKAPLTSILGLTYLIKTEIANENYEVVAHYLQLIEKSVDKLISTIGEISYYAINNHSLVQCKLIDPHSLLDTIWNRLRYSEGANKVTHTFNIDNKADWYSDKNRLNNIIENLLSNAIKFRDESKNNSFINISLEVTENIVTIKVEDNGIGIQEKFINKIFDMYYKASSAGDGAGLGLYLVKETVAKLNGSIQVFSKLKEGTCFIIEIPNCKKDDSI